MEIVKQNNDPFPMDTTSQQDLLNQLIVSLGDEPITSLRTLLVATGCVESCHRHKSPNKIISPLD